MKESRVVRNKAKVGMKKPHFREQHFPGDGLENLILQKNLL